MANSVPADDNANAPDSRRQHPNSQSQLAFDLELDNSTLQLLFKVYDSDKMKEERHETLLSLSELTDDKT